MTLPEQMSGILLVAHGGPEALVWSDTIAVPRPKCGEALIRVAAAGVNNTDINTRTGWYSPDVSGPTEEGATAESGGWAGALEFPRIQGADACGRIVAVGAGVDTARIGKRVLVEPVFRGADRFDVRYFGSEVDGAFADFACVPAVHAHHIECDLSNVELASFPCAYSAAENILTRIALSAGERVLITGASGLGKSELGLELIASGNGLVADDAVDLYRINQTTIEGRCPELLQNLLEVRGIGLLDIQAIFGETAVRRKMRLKLIVHLVRKETLERDYDRLPHEPLSQDVLGVPVRKVVVQVVAGRNIAVLVEAAVRNTILQLRGVDTYQEFMARHQRAMAQGGS